MRTALDYVDQQVANGASPACIVAINPEKVYAARRDPRLAEFIENGGLLIPDGIGVVMAVRWLHGSKIGRVPGADLMQEICANSVRNGHRLFIYGAAAEVNRGAVDELRRRYPGIAIVGHRDGFVGPDAMNELVEEINASKADILFLALGSPRQEEWMKSFGPKLSVRVCMGIGGTLDTIVGKVKRAPKFWQSLGLEWLYRLMCEPSRFRRQLNLPRFAWEVFREKLAKSL